MLYHCGWLITELVNVATTWELNPWEIEVSKKATDVSNCMLRNWAYLGFHISADNRKKRHNTKVHSLFARSD